MSYQYDMSPTADPGIGFEPDRLQAIDFQRNDANRAALREYLKLGIVGIWKKDSGHRDFPVIAEDLSGCDVSLEGNGQVQWRNGEGWITRAFQHFIRSPHFQPLQTAMGSGDMDLQAHGRESSDGVSVPRSSVVQPAAKSTPSVTHNIYTALTSVRAFPAKLLFHVSAPR